MIVIANMKMPGSCQECPFPYLGIGFATCMARGRYESPDDGGTFLAQRIWDGNGEQRDSSCPLYDDTTIDAALTEITRLREKLAKYEPPEVAGE